MPRIAYLLPGPKVATGGHKVSYRHVEALVRLGYDAVIRTPGDPPQTGWFEHAAPVEVAAGRPDPDDILVAPEDNAELLAGLAPLPNRKVIFCQNAFGAGGQGFGRLSPQVRDRFRIHMACSPGVALWIARFLPHDIVATVPAFADERLFAPAAKQRVIATTPRKRPEELRSIQLMFERLRPDARGWRWDLVFGRSEAETAAALGTASVFLSLAKQEGMSMTILEAMASGCLVAGFTGVGAREYTTAANGLWVGEDDTEAAARALLQAVELAEADGAAAHLMRQAGEVTAAQWTYAAFHEALVNFWRDTMGVAPAR